MLDIREEIKGENMDIIDLVISDEEGEGGEECDDED
jgi:hypothetical protein